MKRLVARELTLSFVPDAEQRLWRTVTRRKYQLTRDHVRLQNQVESLLEEAHIKLSSLVSDLVGRQCPAHADGAGGGRNQGHNSGGKSFPAGRSPIRFTLVLVKIGWLTESDSNSWLKHVSRSL